MDDFSNTGDRVVFVIILLFLTGSLGISKKEIAISISIALKWLKINKIVQSK